MEEQKKKGILTRGKRKMDVVPIAHVEEKKKKKKGNLTLGKRKLEMDDNPIAHVEEQQKKENLTLGKRKLVMDGNTIPRMEEQKKKKGNLALVAHNKKWKMGICSTAAESLHQKLPHEVIVDNILTRLPIRNLAKECALVCKLWYTSILHPHFVLSRTFLQSCRNNRYPNLTVVFDIINTPEVRMNHTRHCTFRLDIDNDNDNDAIYSFRKLTNIRSIGKQEPVGHCNGLQCLRSCCVRGECFFHITNPSCRPKDFMVAMYQVPDKAFIFCCGFGFDSMLNEYKIVLVCSNSSAVIDVHDTFKCMVFTLGSKSWRESTTPPDTLPVMTVCTGITQERKRVIVSRMSFSRSATYVSGALYWRVLTRDRFGGGIGGEEDEENQETEMLLCFDIHHEQFQLIALPLECELKIKTGTTKITTEQEQQLIDHRLLEFEGSPCIVRLQIGEQQQMNISNCCCKVHLYVLKDRVNSAWSIETFDVCSNTSMIQDMSDPPPCIIATVTSATSTTTTTVTTATTIATAAATTTSTTTTSTTTRAYRPITKILCVADRVILYWFDGACVQFYDLRRKSLKMVKYIPADPNQEVRSFTRKRPGHHWPLANDDVDTANKLIYCRQDNIDYKLHNNLENCLPLKMFIPEGCTIAEEYEKWYSENKDIGDGLGFVFTNERNGMPKYHCFSMEGSQ